MRHGAGAYNHRAEDYAGAGTKHSRKKHKHRCSQMSFGEVGNPA